MKKEDGEPRKRYEYFVLSQTKNAYGSLNVIERQIAMGRANREFAPGKHALLNQ